MVSNKHSQLLARTNFPLYTVHSLTERHVLVAGGGGGAKTGIPNVIEIYELINNGPTCRAESITHFETGSEAIMNCTVHNAGKYCLLFAGMEGCCHVYKIKHIISDESVSIKENVDNKENHVIRRKVNTGEISNEEQTNSEQNTQLDTDRHPDANGNVIHSKLHFEIKHLESFQTDFSEDPFQKLVRFSNTSNILATAGADGHIRMWQHPKFSKVHDIEAHCNDVDDLDICNLGKRIVSVSRDGHGKIWNIEDGSLITELKYALPSKNNGKYTFRSCRFGIVDDKNDLVLFATLNPAVRSKPPSPSYICMWDTNQFSMQKVAAAGTDMLTVMTISDNGRFIGLGTQDGGVKMYIAFSLQQVYNVNRIHGIFVTGLEFLSTQEGSRRITGGHEVSLVSISVDNHVMVHHIPMRHSMGILTLISLLMLTLFIVFVIMDFLNL